MRNLTLASIPAGRYSWCIKLSRVYELELDILTYFIAFGDHFATRKRSFRVPVTGSARRRK